MTILAIGAHFDDTELGCGGSLLRWKSEDHRIVLFVATRSGYADANGLIVRSDETALEEGRAAAAQLGAELIVGRFPTFGLEFGEPLNRELLRALEQVKPDVVITHWSHDTHHDHRALSLATIHCGRHVPRILMYRSNWYQSGQAFNPRFSVNISGYLDQKIDLVALHKSEFGRTGAKWEEFVRAEARLCGLTAGCDAAEAFEVVKWLL